MQQPIQYPVRLTLVLLCKCGTHGYNPPDLVEATTTDQGTWLADFHTVGFDLVAGTGGRSQILNGLNATAVDWNMPSPR